jgi:maleate isomerase
VHAEETLTTPEQHPIGLAFETDEGFGARARLGLVVLESDQTVEPELNSVAVDGVAIYHARIANDLQVTPETLLAMKERLPAAAALLPSEFDFDVIGYGCTSASTFIGDAAVTAAIQSAHPGVLTTNPIAAALAAFKALDVGSVGIVTPYSAVVTAPVVERFSAAGFGVSAVGSFLEESDLVVARISEQSVANAARQLAASADCDAIFVSCTSVRAFGVVAELEDDLGIPVVSSNLALFWHLLRLAGVNDRVPGLGRLYGHGLSAT